MRKITRGSMRVRGSKGVSREDEKSEGKGGK